MPCWIRRQAKLLAEALVKELGGSPVLQATEDLRVPASLISQAWFAIADCLDHNRGYGRRVTTAGNGLSDGFKRQAAFARVGLQWSGNCLCVLGKTGSRESGLNQRDVNTKLPEFMIERFGVAFDCMFARSRLPCKALGGIPQLS